MTSLNLESYTKADKLALLLQVAESVLQDNPSSHIAAQIFNNSQALNASTDNTAFAYTKPRKFTGKRK